MLRRFSFRESQKNPKNIPTNKKSDTGKEIEEMKELRRKVIQDDYEYTYKGKTVIKKSWRVIFDYLIQNGEVKTLKPRFKKKSDAEKKLTKLVEKHRDAKGIFVADKDQILLKDYAEKFYKPAMLKRLSPTSHANEKSRVDEAVKFFEFKTVASITRLDIKAYKEHLQNKTAKNAKKIDGKSPNLSIASVNKYLTRFRAMLSEARADLPGLPEFNFKGVIQKKLEKKRSFTINFFEFDKLQAACYGKQAKMELLIIALWETGARFSEIVGNEKRLDYLPGIKREDIDFENQRIKLWNSKLHPGLPPSFRNAYLSTYFRDALINARKDKLNPDEYIFKRGDFRKSWQIIKERAEINPDFWEKDFRHCFINNCDVAGVPRVAIKHQINHAGDDLLESVYINLDESKLSNLFARYEQFSRMQRAEVEKIKRIQSNLFSNLETSKDSDAKFEYDFSFLPTFQKDTTNPEARS